MTSPSSTLKSPAFKLKGRLYTLTVLQLLSTDEDYFEHQLEELILKAPRMFDGAPIVLDCSVLPDENLDLKSFCDKLRVRNIFPVAIQAGSPLLTSIAQCMGLAVLNGSAMQDKEIKIETSTEPVAVVESVKNKLQTIPVRSGQQVVGKDGDLVIAASVSHGAELLADGNIHVYGVLRGRALAGISGDKSARIFCLSLEAELVSIAGFYRLSDAFEPGLGPCQIFLQDEHIVIESF